MHFALDYLSSVQIWRVLQADTELFQAVTMATFLLHGVHMMWRCRGILKYSLDSHAESPGSNLTIAAALLSFSKAIYPHCCSRPRCINGDPVGGDRLLCLNLSAPLSQAATPGKECSPGSGNCAL